MPYTKTALDWSDEALQSNGNRSIENQPRICKTDTARDKSLVQAKNASDTEFSHADLLERLTDATEAQLQDEDWLLETRVALADAFFSASSVQHEERRWWFSGWHGWETIEYAPDWLHSVDAALTLVSILREHWYIEHISDNRWLGDGSGFRVKLWRPTRNAMVTAHADALPVAICIACLRASVGETA